MCSEAKSEVILGHSQHIIIDCTSNRLVIIVMETFVLSALLQWGGKSYIKIKMKVDFLIGYFSRNEFLNRDHDLLLFSAVLFFDPLSLKKTLNELLIYMMWFMENLWCYWCSLLLLALCWCVQNLFKLFPNVLVLCEFHYCNFSKHSINIWLCICFFELFISSVTLIQQLQYRSSKTVYEHKFSFFQSAVS